MELVPPESFIEWCRQVGIAPDDRYSPPECLVYVPHRDYSRFWVAPKRAAGIPFFVAQMLAGIDGWSQCLIWPRGGVWVHLREADRIEDSTEAAIISGTGVPSGHQGAARFTVG